MGDEAVSAINAENWEDPELKIESIFGQIKKGGQDNELSHITNLEYTIRALTQQGFNQISSDLKYLTM